MFSSRSFIADMAGRQGGRARCPINSPMMCARANDCAGGTDYCCEPEADCIAEHGGIRQCDFNPRDVAGLELWLDSAEQDLTPASWTDRSGHFGPLTSSSPPTLETTPGLHGQPVLRFAESMYDDIHISSEAGGMTLSMVLKAECTGVYHNLFDHLSPAHPNQGNGKTSAIRDEFQQTHSMLRVLADFMLWIDPTCHFELSTVNGVVSDQTADHWQVVTAVLDPPSVSLFSNKKTRKSNTLYTSVGLAFRALALN